MKIKVSLAQMVVATAQPAPNIEKAESFIEEAARGGSDLVCFPEMWTTGFSWGHNKNLAPVHEKIMGRIAGLARRHGIWICGSTLKHNDDGSLSNAATLYNPGGELVGIYRKVHLFRLFDEDRHMTAGQALTVVDAPWGKTGLAVCYDIRFPELFRAYALQGVQIMLTPSAFPHPRLAHWRILVRARAIENQLFMVSVNQVGSEGAVTYCGSSMVVDPWGQTLAEAGPADEMLVTATLDLDHVDRARKQMDVLGDRRPELYRSTRAEDDDSP